MDKSVLIEADDLAVRYPNGEVALYDVTFKIEAPSFTVILGPNGSGKSTLVKTALGLLEPTKGKLRVFGYDCKREHKQIRKLVRYVPQRDNIDMNVPLSVGDIVLMGRLLKKPPLRLTSRKDKQRATHALELVNMDDYWDRAFPELSGGQRQRVLVARALAGDGPLLILDEPLAGTDSESQDLIVKVLGDYHKNEQVSIIMITHDLNPVHLYVKDVLLLKKTLIGFGTPCDIMDPDVLKRVYGPTARIIEYAGHRYCVTHDSGFDRHD